MRVNGRVQEHVALFNDAQRTGDWQRFATTFTEDAVMTFEGVPAGPYHGREAIAAGYEASPPTDTMTVRSVATEGETDVVAFAWDSGGTGTMTLQWRDDQLAGLRVAFD